MVKKDINIVINMGLYLEKDLNVVYGSGCRKACSLWVILKGRGSASWKHREICKTRCGWAWLIRQSVNWGSWESLRFCLKGSSQSSTVFCFARYFSPMKSYISKRKNSLMIKLFPNMSICWNKFRFPNHCYSRSGRSPFTFLLRTQNLTSPWRRCVFSSPSKRWPVSLDL